VDKQRKTKERERAPLDRSEGSTQLEPTSRDDVRAGEDQESPNTPARGTPGLADPAGARGPVDEDAQRGDARSERNPDQDVASAHLAGPEPAAESD
jgi:hypothetical protein